MTFGYTFIQADSMDPYAIARSICVTIVLGVIALLVRRVMHSRRATGTKKPQAPAKPFAYPTHPAIEMPARAQRMPGASQIESVRGLLGHPPRVFAPNLHAYLAVEPPSWLHGNRDDEQWMNIADQARIRREGQVVWATIVQANENLFRRNSAETGASVIYSPNPWFDLHRDALGHIAHQCFALKGTDPADPESAAFARMLTNELIRGMGMRVPRIFTDGREVYHSSMLMPRKHLPKGFLTGQFFPVWLDPQETGAVVMVPAAYWPASLTMEWDPERA